MSEVSVSPGAAAVTERSVPQASRANRTPTESRPQQIGTRVRQLVQRISQARNPDAGLTALAQPDEAAPPQTESADQPIAPVSGSNNETDQEAPRIAKEVAGLKPDEALQKIAGIRSGEESAAELFEDNDSAENLTTEQRVNKAQRLKDSLTRGNYMRLSNAHDPIWAAEIIRGNEQALFDSEIFPTDRPQGTEQRVLRSFDEILLEVQNLQRLISENPSILFASTDPEEVNAHMAQFNSHIQSYLEFCGGKQIFTRPGLDGIRDMLGDEFIGYQVAKSRVEAKKLSAIREYAGKLSVDSQGKILQRLVDGDIQQAEAQLIGFLPKDQLASYNQEFTVVEGESGRETIDAAGELDLLPISLEAITQTNKPLEIQVLLAENPELQQALDTLLKSGVHLRLQRFTEAPKSLTVLISKVARETQGGAYTTWLPGLIMRGERQKAEGHQEEITQIEKATESFLTITALNPDIGEVFTQELAKLNQALSADRKQYALDKMIRDRPQDDDVKKIAKLAVKVGFAAQGLDMAGFSGLGMMVAGQTDDVLNAVGVDITGAEAGRLRDKILRSLTDKENRVVWGAVGMAAAIDTILPGVFASGQTMVASAGYWLSATLGSMAAEGNQVRKFARAIRQLDEEGKLPKQSQLPPSLLELRRKPEFQKTVRETGRVNEQIDIRAVIRERLVANGFSQEEIEQSLQSVINIDSNQLQELMDNPKSRDIYKTALRETLSDPYRRYLLYGLGLSFGASMAAGGAGILESGAVQATIGPLETLTAMGGTIVDKQLQELRRRYQLHRRLRKATSPVGVKSAEKPTWFDRGLYPESPNFATIPVEAGGVSDNTESQSPRSI